MIYQLFSDKYDYLGSVASDLPIVVGDFIVPPEAHGVDTWRVADRMLLTTAFDEQGLDKVSTVQLTLVEKDS